MADARNDIREDLQKKAVDTLLRDKRLIVNWGTGTGKSRVAVRAVSDLLFDGRERILLLVSETAHKRNWYNEFIGALGDIIGEDVYGSLTVECYASLPKYRNTEWDLIIADEGHHGRSDDRTELLSTMKSEYFLLLSATVSDRGDADGMLAMLERTYGHFSRLDFSLQDSIDNGILAEPKIYVHLLPLADISAPQVITVEWGNPFARKYHEGDCTYEEFLFMESHPERYPVARLHVTCTASQGYEVLSRYVDKAKAAYDKAEQALSKAQASGDPQAVKTAAAKTAAAKNEWLQCGLRRKALLGASKTYFATWLLGRLRDKKYVCFCSDVEQGKALGGDNIIYAERKDNASVISSFDSDAIRSIFAVGMIQEGQNLKGIQAGVIIQLGGKERVFIQKFGRAMRSATPEQHLIVINDTRDVRYYRNAVQSINPGYIKILRYGSEARKQAG